MYTTQKVNGIQLPSIVVDCVVNVDDGIVDLVLMCSMDFCLSSK